MIGAPPRFGDRRRVRIGVLGGSFNPAHQGHLRLAQAALRQLRLQQVWLMVTPGNPLKPDWALAPRLASARALARPPRIIACAPEAAWGTRYSIDSLRRLRRHFPCADFVLLIGADNWRQMPRWRRWRALLRVMPVAIFPRPGQNRAALASMAAQRFRAARLAPGRAAGLAAQKPPAWMFLLTRQDISSSSAIRARASLTRSEIRP